MTENKIKIFIVDDHDLIREGLDRILSFEDNISILRECKNGREVLELLEKEVPDIILLDINMPVLNGIDTLKEIKKRFNKIKVIMLTVEDDRRTITEVIDIGADGYILKESAGSEIVNAIKAVSNNEKYMDVALLKIIFHDIKDNFRKEKSIIYTDKTSVIQQIIK
ncbi:response regulator [Clostridium chauvoei]|uniref:Stage 0 sporulation protein A homolog n=2 Tax=Clostridium chauvoei TaxID=46867 RepID=A0A1U6JJT3_9CLOT|nr:response regulator transcription factor [Clostridium chauvoei]ATD55528.1 hypothetical protein BTM20_09895 [Clostridium chauvoei]ATD56796.1 hypothetical protein BTM21_03130 [Clostridium chauvoei]MBX7281215.1 response regulator transcription factor [Clostridium chauvoei]MBX7283697.1 response regulator transcription factor [Clostridium chauvoei]MBX7286305.1 response regulator transcription factor [Clostridium chauvoei]